MGTIPPDDLVTAKVLWQMQTLNPIMKLRPSLHSRPWGGERWEVSMLKEGPATFGEIPLSQIADVGQIPYLIKFLETSDFLSVQVHPNDEYAQKMANSRGKTECWAVVNAGEGAGIFLGVKEGVTQESFFQVVEKKSDPSSLMNYYPVEVGDFFYVPAGSLHAIGKNIKLIEIQQSCGITYRVWDWNRVDSAGQARELHIIHAREVVCFAPHKNVTPYFQHKKNIFSGGIKTLIGHEDFLASSFMLEQGMSLNLTDNSKRFSAITIADGLLEISRQGMVETIGPYESAILPIGFGAIVIKSIQRCFGVIVK